MARSVFNDVAIRGIAGAVPRNKMDNLADQKYWSEKERRDIIALTGVAEYRKAAADLCTSDLCLHAAGNLLQNLGMEASAIDAVVFATMTPDYRVPSTACILQHKLGCSTSTVAFDMNMGCSGFVVGLYNACALINGAGLERVLLLAGDTQTKLCCEQDKNVVFLLGDAGTATLIEKRAGAGNITIDLMTDGSRFNRLYVPSGGFRSPSTDASREVKRRADGGLRADDHLFMDGMEIFKFSATDVVKSIKGFMDSEGLSVDGIDYLVLHQANKFMNDKIAGKLQFPREKVLYSIGLYGNTGAASIPLTLAHCYPDMKGTSSRHCLLAGFGVGLSWGVVDVVFDSLHCPPIAEVQSQLAS